MLRVFRHRLRGRVATHWWSWPQSPRTRHLRRPKPGKRRNRPPRCPNMPPMAPQRMYATQSILGGVVYTPVTAESTEKVMQKLTDTRLTARFLLNRWKQAAVAASIHDANTGKIAEFRKSAAVPPPQGSLATSLAQAQQQMAAFLPNAPSWPVAASRQAGRRNSPPRL